MSLHVPSSLPPTVLGQTVRVEWLILAEVHNHLNDLTGLEMAMLFYKSYNDSKILEVGALREVKENQACC